MARNQRKARQLMDLSTLTETLLTAMTTLGPVVVALTVLLGTLGLPVPSTALLLAAGALAREGVIDLPTTLLMALAAAVVGDGAGYLLGRKTGKHAATRFGGALWQQASERFAQQGWMAIYLSRWLLTPISVPINVIAGVAGYSTRRFLAAEVTGDLTWIALYVGVGVALGSQWQLASAWIGQYSGYAVLLAAMLLGGWYGVRTVISRTRPTALVNA